MRIYSTLTFCLAFMSTLAFAQKKPLDHSVYDGWKSLTRTAVSHDGKVVASLIAPQEGDTALFIQQIDARRPDKGSSMTMDRVQRFTLTNDGAWTVGLVKAPFAERRQARIDKKKGEDVPRDSLVIINNRSFNRHMIPRVKTYSAPSELGSHIAYTVTLPADTAKKGKPEELLILRSLQTAKEDTLRDAASHRFSKYGNAFAAVIQPDKKKDSTAVAHLLLYDLEEGSRKIISRGMNEYRSLAFDEPGEQLLFLATSDTSKVDQKRFALRYYSPANDSAVILADHFSSGLPKGWIFTEHASPSFSKNGERILVGAAPQRPSKDTTLVDFEMARLDIWHWQDPLIQPQQLVERGREERRTYTGIVHPDQPDRFTPLATEEMPFATISEEGNGRYALLWSNLPYRFHSAWDLSAAYDAWVMDLETNTLKEIATPLAGRPILSPMGNFTYWWDADERNWFAYDNKGGETRDLTTAIPVNFWNEQNDVPRAPGAYGIAAWGEDDAYVLINDRFDIWKVDPRGKKEAENITRHAGRADSITFRYVNTDPDQRYISKNEQLLLTAFDHESKERGYYTLKQTGRNPLQKRVVDPFTFSGLLKAKEADLFVFQKSNFHTSPDLYVTSDFWKSSRKLTHINPQMAEYNWGTAELFSWTSYAGKPLQGILYKPEDFDPAKQYPLMIYFYEKHSDNLYSYFTPAPSRSTVNIPFFVSRGYLVFTPDIDYTVGQPGMDAYNAVVSGAEELAKYAWVDRENMAIQGQSWGGYQVAYIVTQTDLFKAAGSGAPVSNMTSAYGGIRWESGRSRQYQYEQTQSRLGAPMSDSLALYIKNSPVFYADRVNTPLLIMHNDNDGAVPWYQGIELFMSLRRLGKPVWMLQYNNEAHNLVHRRNTKDLAIRLQQFFDHYLKGEPAPVWMTRGVPAIDKGRTWGYELDELDE